MSDENKIIRVTDLVAPAEGDFGERVGKVIDSSGEILGATEEAKDVGRCSKRFGGVYCSRSQGQTGLHYGSGKDENDAFTWNDGESDVVDRPIPPPPGGYLTAADIWREQELQNTSRRDGRPPVDYTKKQPLKPKKPWTVNIGATVPPGAVVTVQEQMQIVFRAKQLVCAPVGGRLYITAVFVGQRVQMMQWSTNGMLMDFLKERTDVDFDTAEPGISITFQVANRGTEPGSFDLSLFGEAAF